MLLGVLAQTGVALSADWGTLTCGTMEELQSIKWQTDALEISNVVITDKAEYPYLGNENHVYVSFSTVNRGSDLAFAMLSLIGLSGSSETTLAPTFILQASTINGVSASTAGKGMGFTYTSANALEKSTLLCWEFAATELP
jgi:hypothetical protein